jgi:hypothetical protein
MRILDAEVAALRREGGRFLLQLRSVTGELLGVELAADGAEALRMSLAPTARADPFDHDGDGKPGGSLPHPAAAAKPPADTAAAPGTVSTDGKPETPSTGE